ncbi:MAG: MFS transporter [Verrucomicrobia bacterium]|nr:MFS transporter [Verrucomicrobiota bacterium]
MKGIPYLRWWIAVLLFGAAVLNYVDRQTLSALAPTIQRDLAMDDRAYADIVNLFLVAYTIAYLVAGSLTDALGTRAGMMVFVAWWSIANALTAAASGVRSLGVFRFALGLGEAGVWPAASKAVGEWFPARERALAIGCYTMGATMGATLAPYLVIPLTSHALGETWPMLARLLGSGAGWRLAFVLTGAAGLLWLIPWAAIYRRPGECRLIGEEELRLITAPDEGPVGDPARAWSWREILTSRVVWLLLFARLLTDPAWYFFQFWFAKYLHSERGLDQRQLTVTWVIYAAAGVGSLLGGWLSGWRIRRGAEAASGRLQVMAGCAVLMLLSPLVASAGSVWAALGFAGLIVAAALAWLINLSALIVDRVPAAALGTVFGVVAAGSTLGGLLMNTLVSAMVASAPAVPAGFLDRAIQAGLGPLLSLVQGRGYGCWFWVMACLHALTWLLLRFGGVGRRAPQSVPFPSS